MLLLNKTNPHRRIAHSLPVISPNGRTIETWEENLHRSDHYIILSMFLLLSLSSSLSLSLSSFYHQHFMLCAIGLYMYCRKRNTTDCLYLHLHLLLLSLTRIWLDGTEYKIHKKAFQYKKKWTRVSCKLWLARQSKDNDSSLTWRKQQPVWPYDHVLCVCGVCVK